MKQQNVTKMFPNMSSQVMAGLLYHILKAKPSISVVKKEKGRLWGLAHMRTV